MPEPPKLTAKSRSGVEIGEGNLKKFNAVEAHSRTVRPSTILSSVSAIALCCVATQPAMAQDASTEQTDEADDEIIVTGIRQSIKSSQEIKRTADTFVDSITAEDIGQLPDRSVTETLQRIPGISISRFAAADDPDHFSVEGAGVVIRGLTFVRSELNGRDTFSANNGRALGFNDVSPELLGAVNVFKQQTADMIEGGLAGSVDLRTRKPFDKRELVLSGSVEANYGDLRKKWSPSFSLYASNVWSSGIGDIGLMLNYSQSELFSRNNGTQITDYTFRNDIDPTRTLLIPRGAGVRSQDFDRERQSYGGALQWESNSGDAKATFEFLRVEAKQAWTERTFEATADQAYTTRPVPGTTFGFDESGQFTDGVLTDTAGWRSAANCPAGQFDNCVPLNGFQHTLARRSVEQESSTQDISLNLEFYPTDRLSFNFDAQYVKSTTENLDFSIFGSTFANSTIDINAGGIPDVQFSAPTPDGSAIADYFSDPTHSFYRAAMDHLEDSEGDEFAFRGDVDYEFDDDSFLRKISAGGRFSSREQTTRFSVYNWGVLSEIWNGSTGPVFFGDVQGSPVDNFAFPNFQRGDASQPSAALYYGGDIISGYRDGSTSTDLININNQWTNAGWRPLAQRSNVIDGTPFTQGETNETREETFASYLRLDFGSDDIFGGMRFNGNIGLRYVNTKFQTRGAFETPTAGDVFSGDCSIPTPNPEEFCLLSPERQALALAFADGVAIPDTAQSSFNNWLPSLNLKLAVTDELIFRFGVSKGISRPELGLTRNFFVAQQNITNLVVGGGDLANGPLFKADVGNPNLRPVEAVNWDLSAEYYFNATGSVTASLFLKDLKNVITSSSEIVSATNSAGLTTDVLVAGPFNTGSGTVKGVELAYNQFYDFLPGPLSGFGFQGNYTYIDSSDIPNSNLNPTAVNGVQPAPTINNLPLQGLSKHNFNAALLYDKYGISARVAYSWRSRYLLTTRDVIFPFSPIWQDASGQLDGSIFYTINEHVKIGVQAVNLLNETTVTRAQVDAPDGSGFGDRVLTPRSYFSNDRRFTFVARFSF